MKATIKFGILYLLAGIVSANPASIIADVLCGLVPEVLGLAQLIAILMFIYGGAKYAYSADDPGGRKQGQSIAIHSIIGFVIVVGSRALVSAMAGGTVCA